MALTNILSTIVISVLLGRVTGTTDATYDVLQYVDPLIGSSNGGS